MQIETYEIEEIKSEVGTLAADHESLELIEKLGLEGQKRLSNKETVTRMPYPQMTDDQDFVYSTLFPEKSKVERYSSGIIPIRILQVISFLKENNFFEKIEIWHSSTRKDKDPVLVGYAKNLETTWRDDTFLIARWGDALLPFEELMKQAKSIAFNNLKHKANEAYLKCKTVMATIECVKDPQEASIDLLRSTPHFTS